MRTPIQSAEQKFFDQVKRHAGPASPFEPQWEDMENFEELKSLINQMFEMGYTVQEAVAIIKSA